MFKKQEYPKDAGKRMGCAGIRKAISLPAMLMLVFFCITAAIAGSTVTVKAGTNFTYSGGNYKIISGSQKTVQFTSLSGSGKTSFTIPDTVKAGQKTYKVTGIAGNAFKNNTKLTKVTIGKNVTSIGKNAFYGCKNLKAITIKTTKLTKSSVGAKAFKGLHAKAVVTVPSGKLAAYKELLKDKGFTGKSQKTKGKKMEKGSMNSVFSTPSDSTDTTAWENYKPGQPLPAPQGSGFTIGDLSKQNAAYIDDNKVMESAEYNLGSDIQFTAGIQMDQHLYGEWKEERITPPKGGGYLECG